MTRPLPRWYRHRTTQPTRRALTTEEFHDLMAQNYYDDAAYDPDAFGAAGRDELVRAETGAELLGWLEYAQGKRATPPTTPHGHTNGHTRPEGVDWYPTI